MRSSNIKINEDKKDRQEKRQERSEERREEKFGVSRDSIEGASPKEGASEFKIKPFIRSIESLKSQVQAEIFQLDQIVAKKAAGSKVANDYRSKFKDIIERIYRTLGEINLIKKGEGGELDTEEARKIATFREWYSNMTNDFIGLKDKWRNAIDDELEILDSDLKDKNINSYLDSAKKIFREATNMLNDYQTKKAKDTKSIKTDKFSDVISITEIIKAGKKYENDSKEGKVIIEVKKIIYNKFKKYLEKTKDWNIVYKSWPNVSGTLLENTQNIIKGVKAGLSKDYPELASDKTGDITPAFITAINKVSENKLNYSEKLISFENFIKGRVYEDFNKEAALDVMSGKSSNKSQYKSDNKIEEYPETPFKSKDEGNKFRKWVNKEHSEWSKENQLDNEGPENNTYIRKAYKEFGEKYEKTLKDQTEAPKKKDLIEDLNDIASWLGASIRSKDVYKYIKGKVDISVDWDADYNGIYIYYNTKGKFVLGEAQMQDSIKGKWDNSGKKYIIDGVTYKGGSIKSALLKVIKDIYKGTGGRINNIKPG
jgi:hypothetical protein